MTGKQVRPSTGHSPAASTHRSFANVARACRLVAESETSRALRGPDRRRHSHPDAQTATARQARPLGPILHHSVTVTEETEIGLAARLSCAGAAEPPVGRALKQLGRSATASPHSTIGSAISRSHHCLLQAGLSPPRANGQAKRGVVWPDRRSETRRLRRRPKCAATKEASEPTVCGPMAFINRRWSDTSATDGPE